MRLWIPKRHSEFFTVFFFSNSARMRIEVHMMTYDFFVRMVILCTHFKGYVFCSHYYIYVDETWVSYTKTYHGVPNSPIPLGHTSVNKSWELAHLRRLFFWAYVVEKVALNTAPFQHHVSAPSHSSRASSPREKRKAAIKNSKKTLIRKTFKVLLECHRSGQRQAKCQNGSLSPYRLPGPVSPYRLIYSLAHLLSVYVQHVSACAKWGRKWGKHTVSLQKSDFSYSTMVEVFFCPLPSLWIPHWTKEGRDEVKPIRS